MVVPAVPVTGGDPCGAGDSFAAAAAARAGRRRGDRRGGGRRGGGRRRRSSPRGGAAAWDAVASAEPRRRRRAPASTRCSRGCARPAGPWWPPAAASTCCTPGTSPRCGRPAGSGDCLVVCINSDESVRRLKGPSRPLVTAADRARVLEALEFVDAVVVFDEDTPADGARPAAPRRLGQGRRLRRRRPARGGGAAPWGGQAVVLPYLDGHSTTALVERSRVDRRYCAISAARGRARPTAVVLRPLGLGDLLTGVPAIRAIRAAVPDHRLVLATTPALEPLAGLIDAVDEVLPARELEPLDWTGPPPELAVDLHGKGPASHVVVADLHPDGCSPSTAPAIPGRAGTPTSTRSGAGAGWSPRDWA